MKILGKARNGKLDIGEYNRRLLNDFLKDPENDGTIIEIKSRTPESRQLRCFLEGAVIPFVTYFQEKMDHRNPKDVEKTRDWLKQEFNSEMVTIGGKSRVVAGSTVGKARDFTEKILTWCEEQGYPTELLNTEEYKKWSEEIYPWSDGADNYLSYLEEIKRLRKP